MLEDDDMRAVFFDLDDFAREAVITIRIRSAAFLAPSFFMMLAR